MKREKANPVFSAQTRRFLRNQSMAQVTFHAALLALNPDQAARAKLPVI